MLHTHYYCIDREYITCRVVVAAAVTIVLSADDLIS